MFQSPPIKNHNPNKILIYDGLQVATIARPPVDPAHKRPTTEFTGYIICIYQVVIIIIVVAIVIYHQHHHYDHHIQGKFYHHHQQVIIIICIYKSFASFHAMI